jgi:hypothetical protein
VAFLGIPDYCRISKLRGINERPGNKSTPRNHFFLFFLTSPFIELLRNHSADSLESIEWR